MNKIKNISASLPFVKKIFLIIITLGIIFRIFTLNYFFWHDEIWTLLRVSGYTQAQLARELEGNRDKNIFDISTLEKYQTTNNDKGLSDTFDSLATEDAHLTPLYFILSRFWMILLGDSIVVTRILPFIFSLAIFPCLYWLCLELFQSSLIAWLTMAMVAVSPVHLFFSSYVRFYSLSILATLILCITLLRAIRLNNRISWIIYTISLTLNLYTYLFSGLVAIGHGIYVLLIEKLKITRKLVAYLISLLGAILLFSPWLIIITKFSSSVGKGTNWLVQNPSIKTRILTWLHNFSIVFFDISNNLTGELLWEKIFLVKLPDILSLLLVVYSFYFLLIQSNRRVYLFIFTLAGSTALLLIIMDLRYGTIASFSQRYLLPSFLAIQLAVAKLIAYQISSVEQRKRKYGYTILTLILLGGILSSLILISKGPWQGSLSLGQLTPNDIKERSEIIKQSKLPVMFGDPSSESLQSLYSQVNSEVKIFLVSKESSIENLDKVLNYSDNIFLYDSSLPLEQVLSKQKDINIVPIFSKSGKIILKKLERKFK